MAFDSLNAFLVMEGHGPYVWTCYGAFFLLLGALLWQSRRARRQVVADQANRQTRQQASDAPGAGQTGPIGNFQRIQTPQNETANKS